MPIKEPPLVMGEVTENNPSGIESVSEEYAIQLGQSRNTGGPGAAGATVEGAAISAATKGGSMPLPLPDSPRVVATLQRFNSPDTAYKLDDGLGKLRSLLSGQFGIRLQSTGDYAAGAQTRIIMQTINVLPTEPLMVSFDQFILAPFTGDGECNIVERDASDIDVFDGEGNKLSGGESEVTLATKDGFADGDTKNGHSRLVKPHTVDKIYKVVFVPGDAGDAIISIKVQPLRRF